MNMMKKVSMGLVAGALTALPLVASAQEESSSVGSAGVDFASAYVFRGVTFNDEPVAQPYLEAEILPGLTVGAWGNYDIGDYDGALDDGQFSEIDLYASYAIPVPCEVTSLSLGYTEYTYPQGGEADREVSLSAGFDIPLAPSLGVFYGFDGAIDKQIYVEAGVGHDLDLAEGVSLGLGATLGYLNPDEGDSGLSHFTVSATIGVGAVSAGVTYIGQIDDDVLVDADAANGILGYDTEVVFTLSFSKEF
ncbi:MAG TPA: TorF family putative porin [Kiritimatiellia bacterium]|nr:TorF family putative porin [Kiritimatiellia bacterium]